MTASSYANTIYPLYVGVAESLLCDIYSYNCKHLLAQTTENKLRCIYVSFTQLQLKAHIMVTNEHMSCTQLQLLNIYTYNGTNNLMNIGTD